MTTETHAWQPSFEGLSLESLEGGSGSAIQAAAVTTITALDRAGLLTERHAVTCQLIIELARAVGRGLAYGKVTVATSTLAKQLLEAIASLPQPTTDASDAAAFDQLAKTLAGL